MAARPLPSLLRRPRRRLPTWRRVLYLALAALAFLGGLLGWLVPVVTGVPLFVASAVLLALAGGRAVTWINALERRLPERWRRGLRNLLRKVPGRRLEARVNLPRRPAVTRRSEA